MDERQPWEQQPDEPNLWFRRFEAFKRMGPRRSLLGAYNAEEAGKSGKKRSRTPGAWDEAAKKWQWIERANSWDAHISHEEEEKWQARRDQLKTQEWEMAQALLEKAQKMLIFPLAETRNETVTEEDGKRVIHQTAIVPVRWGLRDVALLAAEASKLARLATGQETENVSVDLKSAVQQAGFDPNDPFIKELIAQLIVRIAAHETGGANSGVGAERSEPASDSATEGTEGGGSPASGVAAPPSGGG